MMANLWKEFRVLAATRTGVPSIYNYEETERAETKKSSWVVLFLIVVAFAMVLQMESESAKTSMMTEVVSTGPEDVWGAG